MTSAVTYLVVYCYWAGQLLSLIQGQVYSNTPPPDCNPPPALANVNLGQRFFTNFLPWTENYITFDNECFTLFPLEGQEGVYHIYESRIYNNGSRRVFSYLLYNDTSAVLKSRSPSCSYVDTVFDRSTDGTYLAFRCYQGGACQGFDTDPCLLAVFGVSTTFGALTPGQLSQIEDQLRCNGLPPQRYYALPMKYPAQCITSRNCVLKG